MSRLRIYLGGLGSVAAGATAILAAGTSSGAGHKTNRTPSKAELVALGRALFNDRSLSNPPGLACVSCHSPETGFTYPNSRINAKSGLALGAASGRFGHRKPPSVAYSPFMPRGIPHFDEKAQAYLGGLFWDGRAANSFEQIEFPLTDPDEMNNSRNRHAALDFVVRSLRRGPTSALFRTTFGLKAFSRSSKDVMKLAAQAIVAFEESDEVSPFTSKFDAYLEGKAELSPPEQLGMRFVTGTLDGRPNSLPFKRSMHCMDCHGGSASTTIYKPLWSNGCYANLGVPRNPASPRTELDRGLGAFLYANLGFPNMPLTPVDPLRIDGAFRAPTLRNVAKRPSDEFTKCYMHNGYFKNLKDVVHFYNTRNLTTVAGEIIDFTRPNPYAGLKGKPLWPKPEYWPYDSLINASGKAPGRAGGQTPIMDLDASQIGNLRLTPTQEDAIVSFLKTLDDGYFRR